MIRDELFRERHRTPKGNRGNRMVGAPYLAAFYACPDGVGQALEHFLAVRPDVRIGAYSTPRCRRARGPEMSPR